MYRPALNNDDTLWMPSGVSGNGGGGEGSEAWTASWNKVQVRRHEALELWDVRAYRSSI